MTVFDLYDQVCDMLPKHTGNIKNSLFLFKGNQLKMNSICTEFQRFYLEFKMRPFSENNFWKCRGPNELEDIKLEK